MERAGARPRGAQRWGPHTAPHGLSFFHFPNGSSYLLSLLFSPSRAPLDASVFFNPLPQVLSTPNYSLLPSLPLCPPITPSGMHNSTPHPPSMIEAQDPSWLTSRRGFRAPITGGGRWNVPLSSLCLTLPQETPPGRKEGQSREKLQRKKENSPLRGALTCPATPLAPAVSSHSAGPGNGTGEAEPRLGSLSSWGAS